MPHYYTLRSEFLVDTTMPENVYTLGRLWADGHVNRDTIALFGVVEDLEHLIPFLMRMGVGAIYRRQRRTPDGNAFGRESYAIEMNSRVLAKKLLDWDYGFKSYVAPSKVLAAIPTDLRPLFWRGYLDGDGSIYVGPSPKIAFWGTESYDWSELIAVLNAIGVGHSITKYQRKGGRHCSSCLNVRQIAGMARFCEWVYESYAQDALGMPRKHVKAQELRAKAKKARKRRFQPENLVREYKSAA